MLGRETVCCIEAVGYGLLGSSRRVESEPSRFTIYPEGLDGALRRAVG